MNVENLNVPLVRVVTFAGVLISATVWFIAERNSLLGQINQLRDELKEIRREVHGSWATEEQHLFSETMRYKNPNVQVPSTQEIIETYNAIKARRRE